MTDRLAALPANPTVGPLPRDEIETMTGLEVVQAMLENRLPVAPIQGHMGFRLTEADTGRAVFVGTPTQSVLNPQGTVHGGWIVTILDSAQGTAVHTLLNPGEIYVSSSMTSNFLRPVRADGGAVRCEAKAIHRGRTMASVEAQLFDAEGRLLAHGIQTCVILANRGDAK